MTGSSMGKEERKQAILKFLVEYNLALPRMVIYNNMDRKGGITFSERTVKRLLEELADEGLVQKVELGRGYWEATEDGREFVNQMG